MENEKFLMENGFLKGKNLCGKRSFYREMARFGKDGHQKQPSGGSFSRRRRF